MDHDKWVADPCGGNLYLKGHKFYVSYCSRAFDTNEPETALCVYNEEDGSIDYLILCGDWRDQYEQLVPMGIEACLELYENNAEQHGQKWGEKETIRFIMKYIERLPEVKEKHEEQG